MNDKPKRGRPRIIKNELVDTTIFIRKYVSDDNIEEIWTFDLNKRINGPVSVEISYPKNFKSMEDIQDELPKTKRKYFYEEGAKWVNYTRAKGLGII